MLNDHFAKYDYNGSDFEFSFENKIFRDETDHTIINWELVKLFVETVVENLDSLVKKSENLLLAFRQNSIDDPPSESTADFDLLGIELVRIHSGVSEINSLSCFDFVLHFQHEYRTDILDSYTVSFEYCYRRIRLTGVKLTN